MSLLSLLFYEQLYGSLDDVDVAEEGNDICLITDEPLADNFIKLQCGHRFNRIPLQKDIYNHKRLFNSMEASTLKPNQIRCPYCRNIQNELLPYLDGEIKIPGVNYAVEIMQGSNFIIGECSFINEGIHCACKFVKKFRQVNEIFCMEHGNAACSQFYKDEFLKKMKIKEAAKLKVKQEKADAKAEIKAALAIVKQQAKDEKVAAKACEKAAKTVQRQKEKEIILHAKELAKLDKKTKIV